MAVVMKDREGAETVTSPEGVDVLERALRRLGVSGGQRYGLVLRDSRVLCALPANRATALRTLALYQPQRRKAKLLKSGFRLVAGIGWHLRFLKGWTIPGNGAGEGTPVGVLVGSSGHLCDRAVAVLHGPDGWQVVKLAFGGNGGEILSAEAAMLRAMEGKAWVPRLISYDEDGPVAELRMAWQEGRPWNGEDLRPVLDLLNQWLARDEPRALADFPEWRWIRPMLASRPEWAGRVEGLGSLLLRPAIRHGDLTRPNLRIDDDGTLCVHDWERGALDGIPGIDLVHFLVQDRLFRTRKSPRQVVDSVRETLAEPLFREWLADVGWPDRADDLMAFTFALNTGAGYLDQEALLGCLAERETH